MNHDKWHIVKRKKKKYYKPLLKSEKLGLLFVSARTHRASGKALIQNFVQFGFSLSEFWQKRAVHYRRTHSPNNCVVSIHHQRQTSNCLLIPCWAAASTPVEGGEFHLVNMRIVDCMSLNDLPFAVGRLSWRVALELPPHPAMRDCDVNISGLKSQV